MIVMELTVTIVTFWFHLSNVSVTLQLVGALLMLGAASQRESIGAGFYLLHVFGLFICFIRVIFPANNRFCRCGNQSSWRRSILQQIIFSDSRFVLTSNFLLNIQRELDVQ